MQVNEYFDGKVTSIAFQTATLPATVGVMDIGEYEFSTSKKEVMTVVSGCLKVKLPGEDAFTDYQAGAEFTVAADETFHLQVEVQTAYLCTYEQITPLASPPPRFIEEERSQQVENLLHVGQVFNLPVA